jgi:hypothetical protein
MSRTLQEDVAVGNRNQRNFLAMYRLEECQLDPPAVFGIIDADAVQLAVHGFCKSFKLLKMRE